MARKIIAKDILLVDYARNKKEIDKITMLEQRYGRHDFNMANFLNTLYVNLKSFRIIELPNMTLSAFLKSYNFKEDYSYFIFKPASPCFRSRLAQVLLDRTGNPNVNRSNISWSCKFHSKKEIDTVLRGQHSYSDVHVFLIVGKSINPNYSYYYSMNNNCDIKVSKSNVVTDNYFNNLDTDYRIKNAIYFRNNLFNRAGINANYMTVMRDNSTFFNNQIYFTDGTKFRINQVRYNYDRKLNKIGNGVDNLPIDKSGYNLYLYRTKLYERLRQYKETVADKKIMESDELKTLSNLYNKVTTKLFDNIVYSDFNMATVTDAYSNILQVKNIIEDFRIINLKLPTNNNSEKYTDFAIFIEDYKNLERRVKEFCKEM